VEEAIWRLVGMVAQSRRTLLPGSIVTQGGVWRYRSKNDSGVAKTRQRPKSVAGLLLALLRQAVVYGQAFTRLVTLMLPRPVAKSQPVLAGYA
jgi:hypothetical protein